MIQPFSKLLIDRPVPQVLRVLINRPDKRNAIDYEVRQQLTEMCTRLPADTSTRAIVLGGCGGHFSAGGDLPSMVGLSAADARARMQHIANLCRLIHGCAIPVVTAMQGFSAGACVGLALLGDCIVVGENTKILFPFLKLGLVPDWGLLYTLPRRVGLSAARRLLASGATLSGDQAHRVGLADELFADDEVMAAAIRRAVDMAGLPRSAFARMKQRLSFGAASLDEDLAREEEDQAVLLLSDEFHDAHAALTGKRVADSPGESGSDG